jgi:hypothetical protein
VHPPESEPVVETNRFGVAFDDGVVVVGVVGVVVVVVVVLLTVTVDIVDACVVPSVSVATTLNACDPLLNLVVSNSDVSVGAAYGDCVSVWKSEPST